MTALAFSRYSKVPPYPYQVNHGNRINVVYTCHMAAMHWGFMAIGRNQQSANEAVSQFSLASCSGCSRTQPRNIHTSVNPESYAEVFCKTAVRIPTLNQLHQMVDVGDVLITDSKVWPAHSMVVRQNRGSSHVTIRGFNNVGTLGTGARNQYDPVSHNIAQEKYWRDSTQGKFGLTGVDLLVIKHHEFMRVIRTLSKFMLR